MGDDFYGRLLDAMMVPVASAGSCFPVSCGVLVVADGPMVRVLVLSVVDGGLVMVGDSFGGDRVVVRFVPGVGVFGLVLRWFGGSVLREVLVLRRFAVVGVDLFANHAFQLASL